MAEYPSPSGYSTTSTSTSSQLEQFLLDSPSFPSSSSRLTGVYDSSPVPPHVISPTPSSLTGTTMESTNPPSYPNHPSATLPILDPPPTPPSPTLSSVPSDHAPAPAPINLAPTSGAAPSYAQTTPSMDAAHAQPVRAHPHQHQSYGGGSTPYSDGGAHPSSSSSSSGGARPSTAPTSDGRLQPALPIGDTHSETAKSPLESYLSPPSSTPSSRPAPPHQRQQEMANQLHSVMDRLSHVEKQFGVLVHWMKSVDNRLEALETTTEHLSNASHSTREPRESRKKKEKKKRSKSAVEPVTSTAEDEALARKLQEQFDQEAASSTPAATSTGAAPAAAPVASLSDEEYARRLQQAYLRGAGYEDNKAKDGAAPKQPAKPAAAATTTTAPAEKPSIWSRMFGGKQQDEDKKKDGAGAKAGGKTSAATGAPPPTGIPAGAIPMQLPDGRMAYYAPAPPGSYPSGGAGAASPPMSYPSYMPMAGQTPYGQPAMSYTPMYYTAPSDGK